MELCTREFFGNGAAGAAATARRSSSSACRVRDRRCSSRSSPRIRRSKARWNWPTSRASASALDRHASGQRYPGVLAALIGGRVPGFGEAYLRDTRHYRVRDTPFFIDKMPNNFRHVGLIHLMLPNAKIIDARREPMACCFSNFKQLFATRPAVHLQPRRHRPLLPQSMCELMDHWDAVLPGRVLRVQHEDVIDDLEGSVRRILDFCGLEFEPACVEFHRTERRVHTASSEQVRRPINREGVDQWRNFEPWLGDLARRRWARCALLGRADAGRALLVLDDPPRPRRSSARWPTGRSARGTASRGAATRRSQTWLGANASLRKPTICGATIRLPTLATNSVAAQNCARMRGSHRLCSRPKQGPM